MGALANAIMGLAIVVALLGLGLKIEKVNDTLKQQTCQK